MRRISLLMTVLVLSLSGLATAQLPVQEVGENLILNGIQSAEAIFQSAEWVLDLAPLGEYVFPGCGEEGLGQVAALAEEAEALGFGWSSTSALLSRLFDPAGAPRTSFEFRERVIEINNTLYQADSYAAKTQSLLLTAICTVEQVLGLIETVSGLEGKLSVQQTLSQQLGKLQQLKTEGNVQRSAFERARSLEGLTPVVLQQGMYNVLEEMMLDHPRW